MTLVDDFRQHLAALHLPPGRGLVAVSGGPDSVALLDLLYRTREEHRLELVVAHFDHGIHPASAQVAEAVRALAAAYGLVCEVGEGKLGPGAAETLARAARYDWLEATRLRFSASVVLTAHHADDQVETVLMRALAGSGPAGLAGMAARRGSIVRPLLAIRRERLHRHVRTERLEAWSDPANQDPRHLRAWLRGDVLPMLRARLPRIDAAMLSVSRHATRDRAAWCAVLELLPGLDYRLDRDGFSVAARVLSGYDSSLGELVLMTAARRAGCRLGAARAGRVLRIAARGASGMSAPLGEGWIAEIAFGRVVVSRRVPSRGPAPAAWPIEGAEGHGHWGRWRFRWRRQAAPEWQERSGLSVWMPEAPLMVRAWKEGERLRPLGGLGRRLLVRCFQEARVPRSRRVEWPVVAGTDGVVWIPGVCRSDAFLPAAGTEAVRIDAEYA